MKSYSSTTRGDYKTFQSKIDIDDFEYCYQRIGIARNAVEKPAEHALGKWFNVKSYAEDGQTENNLLEDKIWEFNQTHHLKDRLLEADIYARIYGLGLVFLGLIDAVEDLAQPPVNPLGVEYITAISRREIKDIHYVEDPTDPHYGDIETYEIKIATKKGGITDTKLVHRDRCLHVMERTLKKSPWGLSVLEPAYDNLQILKNVMWSTGEAHYKNATPIYVMSEVPLEGFKGNPSTTELDNIETILKNLNATSYLINPKRWKFEAISGSGRMIPLDTMLDPLLSHLAGDLQVPKQILLGTEAGALASGQVNLAEYYGDIASKQQNFFTPLLTDLYRRLQNWHILPPGAFDLEWLPLYELDENAETDIMFKKAQTASILSGDPATGRSAIATVEEIRKHILGFNPEMGKGVD